MKVEIEGLTDVEVASLAASLDEKLGELERKSQTADTSKLALYAALDYAAQLYNFRQKLKDENMASKMRLDGMIRKIRSAVKS